MRSPLPTQCLGRSTYSLPDLHPFEQLRKQIHSQPDLSNNESATAALVAKHLRSLEAYTIHEKIGSHGLAAVLKNGPGRKILLRADMDALPILEQTGLPYASKATQRDDAGIERPVMHACGHDVHVVCLLAAAEVFAATRAAWSGTIILVFQPAEEKGSGARAMVDGGLYSLVPTPDIVLGQHVDAARAGNIRMRAGTQMAAADSFKITFFGRGGHGSAPQRAIDPVVMAACAVVRLQTVVSREIGPLESAVVTVGSIKGGETENVIPAMAEMRVNVRSFDEGTRERVLAAVKRIVKAESDASGAEKEPEFEVISRFPLTVNDKVLAEEVGKVFREKFEGKFDGEAGRESASEDFTVLGTAIGKPCLFWFFGGTDPEVYDEAERKGEVDKIPSNHSPFFAPIMQPTINVGVEALCAAAFHFLALE